MTDANRYLVTVTMGGASDGAVGMELDDGADEEVRFSACCIS
jgi:hypothetical protein